MLTEYEAQKLQRDLKHDLDAGLGVVLKCGSGLLLVVVLALIGF